MNHGRIQGMLLSLATAAALMATLANAMPPTSFKQAKQMQGSASSALPGFQEEMVSQFIVKPKPGGVKLQRELQGLNASALARVANTSMNVVRQMSGGAHVLTLDQPVRLSEANRIAARLMRESSVEVAEPDRKMRALTILPTDPGYINQWHYYMPDGAGNKGGANLPAAWDRTKGLASVRVAVVDTGYRPHVDLAPVLPGYDFITDPHVARDNNGRDNDARDEGNYGTATECKTPVNVKSDWHGTHVTGTIAALMSNNINKANDPHGTGVAPNVGIVPVRVLGRCGEGTMSDVIDGMRWAAGLTVPGMATNTSNYAHVLNLSLGADGSCASVMQDAINDIVKAGRVLFAASGNSASNVVSTPANCNGVVAVTAHAIDGDNAYYSDIGAAVALSAPGGGCGFLNYLNSACSSSTNAKGIYSLSNEGDTTPGADSYASYQGTSMATAHVSGVAALMLSLNQALTPAQIKSYLQSAARSHPDNSTCTQNRYAGMCGAGLLDADKALTKTVELAPIVMLTNAYQVVAPNESVELSGVNSTVAPGTGRRIVSYRWEQQTGESVGATHGAGTDTLRFSAPTTGIYAFKLTVTDSAGKEGTAIATVRVNSPPVLDALPTQRGRTGSAINFSVTATDADGDPLKFHSVSLPAGATLSTAGEFNWPDVQTAGMHTLTYYASDYDGNSSVGTVEINITESRPAKGAGGGGSMDKLNLVGLVLLVVGLRARRYLKKSVK